MLRWTVTYATRVRSKPSITGDAYEMLPVGDAFNGLEALTFVETRPDVAGKIGHWVQLPDGRWTAQDYNGKTFMKSVSTQTWTPGLYRVNHDNPSRTSLPGWLPGGNVGAQTPEVVPMFLTQSDDAGTNQTNVDDYEDLFGRLNFWNDKKLQYLYAGNTALFGAGNLESLTMGGNILYIEEVVKSFGRVRTFTNFPVEWTWRNHPEAIQRFVVVGYNAQDKCTYWVDPPPGEIYWPLISSKSVWIQMERLSLYPWLSPMV